MIVRIRLHTEKPIERYFEYMNYGFKYLEHKIFPLKEFDEEISWIQAQVKMRQDGYWGSCKHFKKDTDEWPAGTSFGEMYINLEKVSELPDYAMEVYQKYIQVLREERLSKLLK